MKDDLREQVWNALKERVCSDPAKAKRCVMVQREDFDAAIGVMQSHYDALREALEEALIKQENDRTLWNEEWQIWAADARAALEKSNG